MLAAAKNQKSNGASKNLLGRSLCRIQGTYAIVLIVSLSIVMPAQASAQMPGTPPIANNLSIAVDYGSQVSNSTTATDPDGDTLTFEVVNTPAKGNLFFNADGTFVYAPTIFQIDTDSFTFRASDGQLNSNDAIVDISITRSAEISAKYDLRVQNNAHYRGNVIANPEKSVIINDVAVIDLDDDGDEDVLVTQHMTSETDPAFYQELEMVIFRNIGNAYVKEATGVFVNMRDYTVSDFNGDGLQDIFLGNQGFDVFPHSGGQDRLLLQNSDGTLSDLTSSNVPGGLFLTHAVCSGDFDNDGDADLYFANLGPNPSDHKIYENDGAGVFTDATTTLLPPEMQLMVDPPNPRVSFGWCEVADFNLDGRGDLMLGQRDFGISEQDTADANGTLLGDSLVVLYGSDQNTLVTNYASGLLTVNWDGPTTIAEVNDIKVADFNRDNCLDVVVASQFWGQGPGSADFADNRSVYFGDCAGGFGDPFNYTQLMVVQDAGTHLITDFNDDGFPDFAHRYQFDAYIDGQPESTPVSAADYHPRAYINNQSLTEPFTIRGLTRWDVEQLKIDEFLGLIHNSLPVLDLSDLDTDGDGVFDNVDAFPNDPNESVDTDTDGIGNNADTDDDGDTMLDVFESANGLDPLDAADAAGDADGDGFTNLEEFQAGTDPQDPESKPSHDLSWLFLLLLGGQDGPDE